MLSPIPVKPGDFSISRCVLREIHNKTTAHELTMSLHHRIKALMLMVPPWSSSCHPFPTQLLQNSLEAIIIQRSPLCIGTTEPQRSVLSKWVKSASPIRPLVAEPKVCDTVGGGARKGKGPETRKSSHTQPFFSLLDVSFNLYLIFSQICSTHKAHVTHNSICARILQRCLPFNFHFELAVFLYLQYLW